MKIKKFIEPILLIFIVISMTIINMWHVIIHAFTAPKGTIFIGIAHHYEDYFYYLSQLTQGVRGSWQIENLYTTEPIPPTPLWWTNILLGKIALITHIEVWTMYDIALFITTAISILVLYLVARQLYPASPTKRIITLLVASLSTCGYRFTKGPDGITRIDPFYYFYNYTSSLNRLGGVVHLMVQNILSIIVIFGYANILQNIFIGPYNPRKAAISLVGVSLSAFLLSFINPVYVMTNAVPMAIVTIGLLIIKFKIIRFVRLFVSGIIISVPMIIPYLIMQKTFLIPFYQYFRWWESSVLRAPQVTFFQSYGPLLVLAIVGILPFVIRLSITKTLGLLWAIIPIIIYWSPLPEKIQIPVFRLPQPSSYIILGALVTESLALPGQFISMITKRKNLAFPIFIIMTCIYLAYQEPMVAEEVRSRNENYTLTSWLNNMDPVLIYGLKVLETLPHNKNVLAFNNLELVVPAITGHRVYAAHRSLTIEYPRKIAEVASLYSGKYTASEASEFLKKNNIGYVLWKKVDGFSESFAVPYSTLITKFYEDRSLIIYTVN